MEKASMGYDVFCGIDVGKASHYIVALGRDGGERLVSRPLRQDEADIRAALLEASLHGRALVTVDQHGSFGRLVVAVARDAGLDVSCIPPRSFRMIAETYDESKTDALDAYIIADVSRSAPRLVGPVPERCEALGEMKALGAFRDAAVKERTAGYNRLHDLLQQACPPLEALLSGERLHSTLALRLIGRYGGPLGLRRAGKARVTRWASGLKGHKARGERLAGEVFEALSAMTVAMPAAEVLEWQARRLALRLLDLEAEEKELLRMIEARAEFVPDVALLRTIPGIGPVFASAIAGEVGDVGRFRDSSHLASYCGVAPRRRESGASAGRGRKSRGGNRRLKNAMVESSQLACQRDPGCRAYYDRKRAEGKSHRQALLALARRRVDVIYAVLRSGTPYEPLTKAA